ncbi:amino acid permease [Streptacidiphilus sp. PB12-B1b]|uniref:amino acid permease n=1 Tax=Streptacidiphilus sp. PB12-B1b TaxID=2705012 RepID=UPI0015FE3AA9|nr:amino acid permease [Streptacidiphilus sp. PB12-B1b]
MSPDHQHPAVPGGTRGWLHTRPVLLVAFAFAVMADPVSSVAYAIEAALRALHGDLDLLLPTMGLVVALIGLVIVNYHQLVARYPGGGGAAAAAGEAFGEAWAFVPIGALIVDFVLTIAISSAAGASAIIAYLPAAAPWRIPLALALTAAVAGLTWFGHLGRAVFAAMTLAFIAVTTLVLIDGLNAPVHPSGTTTHTPGHWAPLAVALAFPVAMALATGVEAPSSAIAQLGQLDDKGRRRFGRTTLWLTLVIVGTITLGMTAEAVHLRIGIPAPDSTQIADLAQRAAPKALYAIFQLATALLLLSAASSSFQAGPGLLKALARHHDQDGDTGILPTPWGTTNRHHTPYWGVLAFLLASAAVITAAGGQDQRLVLFYAVSVFMAFLAGLLAMARFAAREHHHGHLALNAVGALAVAFTLAVNLARGEPLASLAAALFIAAILHRLWIRAGRPRGIRNAAANAEATPGQAQSTDAAHRPT